MRRAVTLAGEISRRLGAMRSVVILAAVWAGTVAAQSPPNTFPTTGNAGIGTATPGAPLQAYGTGDVWATFGPGVPAGTNGLNIGLCRLNLRGGRLLHPRSLLGEQCQPVL